MSKRNPDVYTGRFRLPGELSRRDLIRRAGVVGAGAVGLGLSGCKNRPDEELIDSSTEPQLPQSGGTLSGQITGLLGGDGAGSATVRLVGLGQFDADTDGSFEARITQLGDYDVEITAPGHHKRTGRLRIAGNTSLNVTLLESDAGLPMNFLNEYARGSGPGKEGVSPRTPGATNRWTQAPVVQIYRRPPDDDKGFVSDVRLTAMQTAIASLFGPLTGNLLGSATVEVRGGTPPDSLSDIPAGRLVIAQREDGRISSTHGGAVSNPFEIVKARIACGVDSTIEIFNRMFAHALGGYVVSPNIASVLNGAGRASPSDKDLLAAAFLYVRDAGNTAPDRDRDGVFLN